MTIHLLSKILKMVIFLLKLLKFIQQQRVYMLITAKYLYIIYKKLTLEGFAIRPLIKIYTVSSKGTRPPSLIIFRILSPSRVP